VVREREARQEQPIGVLDALELDADVVTRDAHSAAPSALRTVTGSGIGARENTRRWPSRMSSLSRSTTSSPDGA
jgi:hypothetical protein